MMLKRRFKSNIIFISNFFLIIFILTAYVFSEEQKITAKGPIIITSEKLTADSKANTALFEKSVVARTTDMTIYANTMLVFYNKDTGNVTRIDAEGNVRMVKGNRYITSAKSTYFADGEKVIFTGEPRAVEGENVISGKEMTYHINDDLFIVEDSKVFLTGSKKQ